jgi:hypothetical protein
LLAKKLKMLKTKQILLPSEVKNARRIYQLLRYLRN